MSVLKSVLSSVLVGSGESGGFNGIWMTTNKWSVVNA